MSEQKQQDDGLLGGTASGKSQEGAPRRDDCTHSLEIEFGRVLSQAEWREVVQQAWTLPFVRSLIAHASSPESSPRESELEQEIKKWQRHHWAAEVRVTAAEDREQLLQKGCQRLIDTYEEQARLVTRLESPPLTTDVRLRVQKRMFYQSRARELRALLEATAVPQQEQIPEVQR